MDKVAFGMQIQDLLDAEKPQVAQALALIGQQLADDSKDAIRAFVALTEVVVKAQDLAGAVACVEFFGAHSTELKGIDLPQLREVVRRCATTTEEKLFIDAIGLNTAIATAIVKRLGLLIALKPGTYVNSTSWGFGKVQSIDTFYSKVIIDFESKKNHAMSLAVAGQNLTIADENHLMTRLATEPEAIKAMAEKHPAELVRLTLQSYGPLTIARLTDRIIATGLITQANWKTFWDAARRGLKADKQHPVEIPAKRTEPIRILEAEEDFGDKWLKGYAKERDIKAIFEGALAIVANKKGLPDSYRETVANRLNFALKGANNTDFARYAQVACLLRKLGLSTEEEQAKQVATLMDADEQDNLLLAMKGLAARDVSAMVEFLLAVDASVKPALLSRLPKMNSVSLGATLATLKDDEETGAAVREQLTRQAQPVPTLVVWALRNREAAEAWKVPGLNELVTQAMHIVEQRLTGENLRMRNTLQAYFDSDKWLKETVLALTPFERQVMFERIQASITWDTASQRTLLVRMVRYDPTLATLRRVEKAKKEHEHLTSQRSLTALKLAYDHLVQEEIPANTRDIATARSYGDLRENAEYQFAKEHQRVLVSKQGELERTLSTLKVTDFADATTSEVSMGTRVTVETTEGTKAYTILGELDRDETLNIISCRSRLADALLGKTVGTKVELPAEKGTLAATITAIEAMDDAVKAWLAQVPTEYQPNA